ncbi:shikimate kinase [Fluviispira multicolorata]|nr:shikimate kinase [Fluviispira multicolorata]
MTKYWAKKFKNIILTGMPGSGKTAFGKIYAHVSERLFLDFDAFIESTTKKSITQLFEIEGEDGFRNLEEKILHKLERRHNFVIAMGGGTLLKPDNLNYARRLGLIVTLKTPLEIISKRIFEIKETRPLFINCKTIEDVQEKVNILWDERKDAYEQSDVVIETAYNSIDTLKMHLSLIERRADNREYMQEVYNIINKKLKQSNRWVEKDEVIPEKISDL